MGRKLLMKGNEALAEAAIRAGCKLFFGYPITPQTELSEYMAKNMPKRGGCWVLLRPAHGSSRRRRRRAFRSKAKAFRT